MYFEAAIIFIILFLFTSVLTVCKSRVIKNADRLPALERRLLARLPVHTRFMHALFPAQVKRFLFFMKYKKIEDELPDVIENISSSASGGVPVFTFISENIEGIKQPLKNELRYLLMLSRKDGNIKALEHVTDKTPNVFLKLFWITITEGIKTGAGLVPNLKKLHGTLHTRRSIKNRITAHLAQVKIQMYIGTVFPYFLLFVLSLMYPALLDPVFEDPAGKFIIMTSLGIHGAGVLLYRKICRFDIRRELADSLFLEYVALSLKSGNSILQSVRSFCRTGLMDKKTVSIIETSGSTAELLDNLKNSGNSGLKNASVILARGYSLGISISGDLSGRAEAILGNLEHRASMFAQTAPAKALIPMLLFIFPATYLLILSPVIIEILNSSFL